jgi:hypothetical protein
MATLPQPTDRHAYTVRAEAYWEHLQECIPRLLNGNDL